MEDSLAGMGHNWKISEMKNLCGKTDEPQSHQKSEHRKRELGRKESVVRIFTVPRFYSSKVIVVTGMSQEQGRGNKISHSQLSNSNQGEEADWREPGLEMKAVRTIQLQYPEGEET